MGRWTLACWLVLLAAGLLPAQARERVKRLVLTPAKPASPALRFALLPELRTQTPGDAAPLYRKATELMDDLPPEPGQQLLRDQLDNWITLPGQDLPADEVRRVLTIYREPLALVEQATLREACHWGLAEQIRQQGFSLGMGDMKQLERAAQLLCLRARLELRADYPETALRTLQRAFQIGRHVALAPFVSCLHTASTIWTAAGGVLEECLAHGRTPNLSWSLTGLPQPLLDPRPALEGERLLMHHFIPGLPEVCRNTRTSLTPEQADRTVQALLFFFRNDHGNNSELLDRVLMAPKVRPELLDRVLMARKIRSKHETACRALREQGWSNEHLAAMPHLQAAWLHSLLWYDQGLDEMLKTQTLSLWQALPELDALTSGARSGATGLLSIPAVPLGSFVSYNLYGVFRGQARLERQFASLRCLEALRLHAAEHAGRLPRSLAEVKEIPLPLDPVTGTSFEYRLDGEKAILSTPLHSGHRVERLVYEVTLRR